MTLNERIEANADLILWCVAVAGPDEVHACANHDAAVVRAGEMNEALHRRDDASVKDILCFAYPAPWPWSKDEHAEDLAKQEAQRAPSKESEPDSLATAAAALIAARFSTYTAKNGREVGIEDENGEKCWIVPFEEMDALERAISAKRER